MFEESLAIARELGYRELIAYGLEGCGEVAAARDDGRRAARLLGAALALFEEIGAELGVEERDGYDRAVAQLRRELGEDAFAALEREGRALSAEAAAAEALAAAAPSTRLPVVRDVEDAVAEGAGQ